MLFLLALAGCPAPPSPPVVVVAPEVALSTAAPAAGPVHHLTFVNNCAETIWVGSTGNAGQAPIGGGGWEMASTTQVVKDIPVGWQGRFWPRTGCAFTPENVCPETAAGTPGPACCTTGSCLTSDDQTFGLACAQSGLPPASLVEPTFDAAGGRGPYDDYDISLVDGWSVPVSMEPVPGTFNPDPDPGLQAPWCTLDGCAAPPACPPDYVVAGSPDSCWSPCQAAVNAGATQGDVEKLCCVCATAGACSCAATQPGGSNPGCCTTPSGTGAYGCTPYASPPWPSDLTCTPVNTEHPDRAWDPVAVSYIDAVHAACPGAYAWQFDDVRASYQCRKTDGLVDYVITFCPKPSVTAP